MARPRRGFLFELDATVLFEGLRIHREGGAEFYGLQVANRLRVEKITVYRSLRRLTELGLLDRRWEDQDIASAEGRPRRRLYALNQHGKDALPYALKGARALGRQHPQDSNSVTPRRPLPSLARGARPRPRRSGSSGRRRGAR
jgi:PadR family transcriptional regulator, regulatory protein PadR